MSVVAEVRCALKRLPLPASLPQILVFLVAVTKYPTKASERRKDLIDSRSEGPSRGGHGSRETVIICLQEAERPVDAVLS